jgi:DNA modification methylase
MHPWLDRCHFGNCVETMRRMPAGITNTCITSPPYFGLRDYGHDGQIGLEETPGAFVAKLVEVFREVRRVLRDDGTLWLNLGDSYGGSGRGGYPGGAGTLQGTTEGQDSSRSAREVRTHSAKELPDGQGQSAAGGIS